jgi:Thermolysin metallopeptidase, alpha-helical domain/Thermolysin metallopeptidase, catalytic domain
MPCTIVPPYLLQALTAVDDPGLAASAAATLRRDAAHRARRQGRPDAVPRAGAPGPATEEPVEPVEPGTSGPQRVVSDAGGGEELPGTRVRSEGDPATGDAAADEAYDGLGLTWALFSEAFGRNSLDGRGLPLLGTVHYGQAYDNAFWDGTQMVFGDGDGVVFNRFTLAVDVIGHELSHGVTEYTAGLTYQGQSGALNESVSDVFGVLVRQRQLGQPATEADWLVGAGLFTDAVQGVALRSMKAPGTAYDDPRLGKDPQPAHMDDYVSTTEDNGGVHINSGIPNHAFYRFATALGGPAWEVAGQVWYDTLTGDGIAADCDFATFAQLTIASASSRYGEGSPEALAAEQAWRDVGVLAAAPDGDQPADPGPVTDTTPAPQPRPGTAVQVRRTGGIAGLRQARTVVLDELPEPDARGWRSLLTGDELAHLAAAAPRRPVPDAYTYHVSCPPDGDEVVLPEHGLPGAVRDLFRRTLGG